MSTSPTRLRGFRDLTGADLRLMREIEDRARAVVERYGFNEIRVPILEPIELFERSTGATSDIVEKQMYSFTDRDEAEPIVVMRPEGTPGVIRAYIEAGLDRTDPEQHYWYGGPMFRRERPQKGRYRQFYQFGVEVFGRADAATDAELIIMIDDLRGELGLDLTTELNSLGCNREDCRPRFRAALLEFGRAHIDELCADCKARLERNPLRLLDCKIDVRLVQSAPKSLDYLCDECRTHFDAVIALIAEAGVKYQINPRLVRGLDYYTRTAFEVVSSSVGAQSAVVAGGRYDGLIEALGGAAVPGVGFAIGVDRMALALEATERETNRVTDAAIAALGDDAMRRAMSLARELRRAGLRIELLSPDRGLKANLKRADKLGACFAVIIGSAELTRGVVQLRDLKASSQREIAIDELASAVKEATNA